MAQETTNSSLELLFNISRELSASLEFPLVLERVLSLSTESIGAERGALIVLDAASQPVAAALVVNHQLLRPSAAEMTETLDHGLAGWVAAHREPVLVENTARDERWLRRPDDELTASGPKSAVCIPLLAEDQLIGVLTLVHASPHFFTDQHMRLATAIADLAGVAVRNARLYAAAEEAQRRYRELFEDSIDSILLTGWDGRILAANRQAAHSLGKGPGQLVGLSALDLHAAALDRLGTDFSNLRGGQTISYESQLRAFDGTTFPIEVHARAVQLEHESILQWILRDIRERKQLDTLRDDLMAMIYHDLRSPLANVISSLDVLTTLLPAESDPAIATVHQIATRSADRLQRLISSLLDIYRLESGQAIIRIGEVNCASLVRECVDIVAPLVESKSQRLTIAPAAEDLKIFADYDMIRRVCINLLENAVKFTPNSASVEVGCVQDQNNVRFWVSDNGPGIPEESRELIFEKFSRLQTDRYPKGIGLGLAFCRLAVQAHGGKIWVTRSESGGSLFIFTLPINA